MAEAVSCMEINEKLVKPIEEVKYLNVENTDRYRPIIRYFFRQYERLEYWLYKEDVFNALKNSFDNYTIEQCEQDLLRLTEWGNLTNFQDTNNVKTIDEFKNRKYRYQLTEYAVEIERLVMHLENLKIETASLEPKLFEKLKILLEKITLSSDASEINTNFEDLNETFTKLNNNYKDFLKMFCEVKTEELLKSEMFLAYKDKVVDYLKNFISGFQINEMKIKNIINSFPEDFEEKLISKVMEYKRNQPILELDFDYEYLEDVLRGKWRSVIKWFNPDKNEESETERLKRAINNIINKITKYVVAIIESNTSINRMEEYRHILKLFSNCKNIKECEQLSSVVFGIEKVKHISGIEKTTDSVNINPKDSEPVFLSLKSHSRIVKEKAIKYQVQNKGFEKEQQLKKILEQKHREQELLNNYIKKGFIVINDLENIEKFERRFILSLITKGINKDIVKNAEYGVSYKIEKIDESEAKMVSIDGIMTMNNIKIIFIGEKNGI